SLDQAVLRRALALSSSYLVTDTSMNPRTGCTTWFVGLEQLVDLLIALHARQELELETVNAASRACSECWTVAGTWRGLEECREGVKKVGTKLKNLLDENGRTYRGETGKCSIPTGLCYPCSTQCSSSLLSVGACSSTCISSGISTHMTLKIPIVLPSNCHRING
ncbi:hypothetical protein B0H10DRAFT_1805404, partial [Mycena sp. CBHHK59/15]